MIWILTLVLAISAIGSPASADPSFSTARRAAVLGSQRQAALDDEEGGGGAGWLGQRALYARGGMATWTAIFGDNFGTSFGIQAGYAYGLRPQLVLRGGGGVFHFSADSIEQAERRLHRSTAEATITLVPLLVGVDYLLATGSSWQPYVGGAAGPVYVRANFNDVDAAFFAYDDLSEVYLGVAGRAGLTVLRPGSNIGFDVGAGYNVIADDLSEFDMGDSSHHDYYEVTAGILYFLGSR